MRSKWSPCSKPRRREPIANKAGSLICLLLLVRLIEPKEAGRKTKEDEKSEALIFSTLSSPPLSPAKQGKRVNRFPSESPSFPGLKSRPSLLPCSRKQKKRKLVFFYEENAQRAKRISSNLCSPRNLQARLSAAALHTSLPQA